jgi:hypothetical protein
MKLVSLAIVFAGMLGATVGEPIDPQWGEWGLAGIVIGIVMYRDYRREDRLAERLSKQEDWIKDSLVETLQENTAAIEKLAQRPCMLDKA